MADRYQEYNEIERMIRCIEQAEDNLKEYEALKNALLPDAMEGVQFQLKCHEQFAADCLVRIRHLRRDLEKARSLMREYEDFMTGRDLPVIYGPPEVMGIDSDDSSSL